MDPQIPRVLCVVQLPPPVHGPSFLNQKIVDSERIRSRFELRTLPMRFSKDLSALDRASLRKVFLALVLYLRLAKTIVKERPSLVYFTLTPTGGGLLRDLGIVAILRLFGLKRVYHLHGKGIKARLQSSIWRRIYGWVFHGSWVIHLSDRLVGDIAPLVPPERILVVPNGIEGAADEPAGHLGATRPRILFISNMVRTKGPILLVEALAILKNRGLKFEAVFAGNWFNDNCKADFDPLIDRHGLGDIVKYLGPVYGQAKDDLFKSGDIFAYPSYNDCLPLVLLEAMSYGLAVVSTTEGAIPDLVVEGKTGYLIERHAIEGLANRLQALIEDPDLRNRMGKEARRHFLANFTWDIFEQRFCAALETCLSG